MFVLQHGDGQSVLGLGVLDLVDQPVRARGVGAIHLALSAFVFQPLQVHVLLVGQDRRLVGDALPIQVGLQRFDLGQLLGQHAGQFRTIDLRQELVAGDGITCADF